VEDEELMVLMMGRCIDQREYEEFHQVGVVCTAMAVVLALLCSEYECAIGVNCYCVFVVRAVLIIETTINIGFKQSNFCL